MLDFYDKFIRETMTTIPGADAAVNFGAQAVTFSYNPVDRVLRQQNFDLQLNALTDATNGRRMLIEVDDLDGDSSELANMLLRW